MFYSIKNIKNERDQVEKIWSRPDNNVCKYFLPQKNGDKIVFKEVKSPYFPTLNKIRLCTKFDISVLVSRKKD